MESIQNEKSAPQEENLAVRDHLSTDYSLAKFFWLGLITFDIYPFVKMCCISCNINRTAAQYDNKHTRHYATVILLLSWLTFGVYPFIWYHKFCKRVKQELQRRNLGYTFGTKEFWIYNVIFSWTFVCPLIFTHKLCHAVNLINNDENVKGAGFYNRRPEASEGHYYKLLDNTDVNHCPLCGSEDTHRISIPIATQYGVIHKLVCVECYQKYKDEKSANAINTAEKQLNDCKHLFDTGVITEEEYQEKRKQILGL